MIAAYSNCPTESGAGWRRRHAETISRLATEVLPSGSGIDSGTTVDLARSTPNRVVLQTAFHHMNDGGMYDGWTEHTIIVRPDLLSGFVLRITGPNRNEIKDYLYQTFEYVLSHACTQTYDPATETSSFVLSAETDGKAGV